MSLRYQSKKQLLQTNSSSRICTVRITRKLNQPRHSYSLHPTARVSTKPEYMETSKYIMNQQKIKKLKTDLKILKNRKAQIQNPEYEIDLDKDIDTWRFSINQLQSQILDLRDQEKFNIRKKLERPKDFQFIYKALKQQIRTRNNLEEDLDTVQKQMSYFKQKDYQLQEQLNDMSLNKEELLYLQKLTHLQSLKQSKNQIIIAMSNLFKAKQEEMVKVKQNDQYNSLKLEGIELLIEESHCQLKNQSCKVSKKK